MTRRFVEEAPISSKNHPKMEPYLIFLPKEITDQNMEILRQKVALIES
jgi:hypothetical protein